MQTVRPESTASTPAIAKFHSRTSTKNPGAKNDSLTSRLNCLCERTDFVINLPRGTTHG
jgi:hypothetical protein